MLAGDSERVQAAVALARSARLICPVVLAVTLGFGSDPAYGAAARPGDQLAHGSADPSDSADPADTSRLVFRDVSAAVGLPEASAWPDGTFMLPQMMPGGIALLDADGTATWISTKCAGPHRGS